MRLIVALLLVGLLVGCVSSPNVDYEDDCAPPIAARNAEPQDVVPTFDHPVDVQVVDVVDGRPLQYASVVLQWMASVPADPLSLTDTPDVHYVVLMTGPSGRVHASVPSDAYVLVNAAAPRFTEEWTPIMEPGTVPGDITLELYPERWTFSFDGTFSGVTTANDPMATRWQAQAFPDIDEEVLARAFLLDVALAWQQDQTQVIDMDLAIGGDPQEPAYIYGTGHRVNAGDAPGLETTWTGAYVQPWSELFIGPYVENGHVLATDVDFQVSAELLLSKGDRISRQCSLFPNSERIQEFPVEPTTALQVVQGAGPLALAAVGVVGAAVGAGAAFVVMRRMK